MELNNIYDNLFRSKEFTTSEQQMQEVELSYRFLNDFVSDKVIYGINTGFGPMAQWRVDDEHLKELQYNIIRSHATGAGEPLDDIEVKAAMIVRTCIPSWNSTFEHPV